MKVLKNLVLILLLVVCVTLVQAVPPFQTTIVADYGLEIEATNSLYLEQDANHIFHFRVYNASNGVYITPADVTCGFGITDNYGNILIQIPDVDTVVGYRYDVEILGGNFSELGVYHKGINCQLNDDTKAGVLTQSFEIKPVGEVLSQENNIPVYILMIIILFIIILLLSLCVWLTKGKYSVYIFIAILYIISNVFLLVMWKVSYNFLYYIPFFEVLFNILYKVSTIGYFIFFPVLLFFMFTRKASETEDTKLKNLGYDDKTIKFMKNRR